MPFFTMMSAVSMIRPSLMFFAKVFQVLKPIGGVRARPSNFCACAGIAGNAAARRRLRSFFMGGTVFGVGRKVMRRTGE
jgi:hypothetical protein